MRREKKTFLNEQCKEIHENIRMEKTRDLFKHTGDIKGIFHPRMGTIKDRHGRDLTKPKSGGPTVWTDGTTLWSERELPVQIVDSPLFQAQRPETRTPGLPPSPQFP